MKIEAKTFDSSEWWRWVALPFVTIIGSVIGSLLIGLFLWFGMKMQGGFSEDGWYFRYVMPVGASAMFGFLYAYLACEFAPRGKVIAGTVMVTLLCVVALVGLVSTWMVPGQSVGQAIQVTVGSIATMVAAIAVLVETHKQAERRLGDREATVGTGRG